MGVLSALQRFASWSNLGLGFFLKLAAAVVLGFLFLTTYVAYLLMGPWFATAVMSVVVGIGAHSFNRWPGIATPQLPDLTAPPGSTADYVRVVALSDTHSKLADPKDIPPGDVLVHAGDFTLGGGIKEVRAFNIWLGKCPHKHKIVVGGNHDIVADGLTFERNLCRVNKKRAEQGLAPHGIESGFMEEGQVGYNAMKDAFTNALYIEDEAVTVEGILVYGAPWQPPIPGGHPSAAFDMGDANDTSGERAARWGRIPPNVDVLLTHTPPRGVLDRIFSGFRVGCVSLAERLVVLAKKRNEPAFHVFGHIHEARGAQEGGSLLGKAVQLNTTFINAASVNLNYRLRPEAAVVFDVPLRSKKD